MFVRLAQKDLVKGCRMSDSEPDLGLEDEQSDWCLAVLRTTFVFDCLVQISSSIISTACSNHSRS